MSGAEDLINFDIIETQKENIQPLASGRSAKTLAIAFASSSRSCAPTPGNTRNLNDAIREEYELELKAIQDSDDPLDIYDRYVKWTLGAYPSAQATPESQLRQLLERATKAFQSFNHYKNDPRYLKLWLQYIRLFSDAPRETFAYLARHNIGEGLALFYEEFAGWLEGAGRWRQADEVYKLGIEREARPAERLIRKFGEFQKRFEIRTSRADEPSSPALPTMRPALVAKIDPFATSTPRPADPQAPRPSSAIGGCSKNRGGQTKLTIFSDAEELTTPYPTAANGANGWDNIGTLMERKKENTVEARPWTGETLKTAKRPNGAPKLTVFKDEVNAPFHSLLVHVFTVTGLIVGLRGSCFLQLKSQVPSTNAMTCPTYADNQQLVNPRTGKVERVFVDLQSVYPNEKNAYDEMSLEELRAKARGWLDYGWAAESRKRRSECAHVTSSPALDVARTCNHEQKLEDKAISQNQQKSQGSPKARMESIMAIEFNKEDKVARPKKMKIKEVKGATQTSKSKKAV